MEQLKKYGLTLVATLSLVTVVLLVTGWGQAVASNISSVFVTNDASHAVPVREQNLGSNGNIKVHEQGTANVQGTVSGRPVAPASPWYATEDVVPLNDKVMAGPSSVPINITSITASVPAAPADGELIMFFSYTTGTSTTCDGATFAGSVWHVHHLTDSAPFSAAFPTPLQIGAPAGGKVCLEARASNTTLTVNASGFFGS